MPIQSDGFTKDPGGSGGGSFTPPTGSGFVKVTGGVLDTASSSLGATEIRGLVTGSAASGKAITDDGASGLAWAGPFEPAITTLAKSKGGFGASIASVADGVLKFVSGVLTSVAQLGMAQGGTGVDLSASGGTGKVLCQDASHVISARSLVPGDLPITGTPGTGKVPTTDGSGGLAYQTPSATDSTKLPLTGGTVSGVLTFGSSNSVAGNAIGRNTFGHTEISSGDLVILTPTNQVYINKPFVLNGTHTALASSLSGEWTDANAYHVQSALGCLVECAKLTTRANSTAYSLCPAPAGDVLRCKLQDGSSKRAVALVDASGTVTFESGSHADYVSGSSPASGEVGVYVTASVLTIKPGSAGTRTIGAIIERARA